VKKNIYEQLSEKITLALGHSRFRFPICKTATEFQVAFGNNKTFAVSVGLIIDEFDCLMDHQEFLSMLRDMKQHPLEHCIQVCINIILMFLVCSCHWNL
jgi:hypothetical protein